MCMCGQATSCAVYLIFTPLQVRCYFMHVQPLILTTDIVIDQDLPGGLGELPPPLAPH